MLSSSRVWSRTSMGSRYSMHHIIISVQYQQLRYYRYTGSRTFYILMSQYLHPPTLPRHVCPLSPALPTAARLTSTDIPAYGLAEATTLSQIDRPHPPVPCPLLTVELVPTRLQRKCPTAPSIPPNSLLMVPPVFDGDGP